MDRDFQEIIYCANDDEYRNYCDFCNKLCIERFYKNHLQSGTYINSIHKRQRVIDSSNYN